MSSNLQSNHFIMVQYLYPLEQLGTHVRFTYEGKQFDRVAGIDVSYQDNFYVSALVVFEGKKITLIKIKSGVSNDPYRPSLFFLREGPIISRLIYGESIDLLFVNGHGICHPYSYGLATVVGMTHGIPTIGIARELIKGEYNETPSGNQDVTYILQNGFIKAAAIKTSIGKRSMYVSQGFGMNLQRAVEEYRNWAIHGKVPEPLRLAHLNAKSELLSLGKA